MKLFLFLFIVFLNKGENQSFKSIVWRSGSGFKDDPWEQGHSIRRKKKNPYISLSLSLALFFFLANGFALPYPNK